MVSVFGGGRRPTLNIQPYQGIFHLHPPTVYEHLDPDAPDTNDTFLGQVVLSLPKPRAFTSLVVKLVANYSLTLPGHSAEKGVLGSWECDVSIPKCLEQGEHTFAWSLKVPRSSAPYERCPYGRVFYKLFAIADGPDGAVKGEHVTEVVAVPALEAETAALNERCEGFNEETGPYLMTLLSQHLTVGGVIHYSLNLASAPQELCLHSISASIVQSYALRSHAKPGQTTTPPSHRRLVFHLDHLTPLWSDADNFDALPSASGPGRRPGTVLKTSGATVSRGPYVMARLSPGESLQVSHVARLPDDDLLRATTLDGTNAPIRISHKIVLDVNFSTPGTSPRLLRVERPLTILSCSCYPDNLVLPPYVDIADRKTGERQKRVARAVIRGGRCPGDAYAVCICMIAFDSLIQPLIGVHKAHAAPEPRAEDIFVANKHVQLPPSR